MLVGKSQEASPAATEVNGKDKGPDETYSLATQLAHDVVGLVLAARISQQHARRRVIRASHGQVVLVVKVGVAGVIVRVGASLR